ncbi:hypothetical protein ABM023_06695 [Morganella morganii]
MAAYSLTSLFGMSGAPSGFPVILGFEQQLLLLWRGFMLLAV